MLSQKLSPSSRCLAGESLGKRLQGKPFRIFMADGWILLEKLHNHVRDLAYGDVRRKTRNASAFPKPKSQEVRDNESVLEAVQVTKAPGSFVILCFASRQQSIPGQCLGRSRKSHNQTKKENNCFHVSFPPHLRMARAF